MSTISNSAPEVKRAKQGRSPAYPGIHLANALAKAKALYDHEGKYPSPMPSAFLAWGFSAKSSGGREVRAALRYFGLITVEGDGETGKVKLTDKALRVLLDEREDEGEKKSIIRDLALTPPIHKKIAEQYPEGIRSDATVKHYLVFEEGFNETAAGELVAEFKETAAFAGLFQLDSVMDKNSTASEPGKDAIEPQVNDLVQVEISGVHQYAKPVRVRAVQKADDGSKWVFVDGSSTGIMIDQVVVKGKTPPPASASNPPTLQEDAPLRLGERELLRGPLSKKSGYRLIVSGELGPKELGKLIKLLEAQKAVLSDEDES